MVETSFAAKYCANQRSNPFDGFEPSGNDPQGIAHGDSRALRSIIYGQNTSHDLTLSNSSNNTGPHTLTNIPDTKHTVLAVRRTRRETRDSPVRHSIS